MKWRITYKVHGFGQFPIDMLRYDRSSPSTSEDAGKIANSFSNPDTWVIELVMWGQTKTHSPYVDRWKSFCCTVSDIDSRKI